MNWHLSVCCFAEDLNLQVTCVEGLRPTVRRYGHQRVTVVAAHDADLRPFSSTPGCNHHVRCSTDTPVIKHFAPRRQALLIWGVECLYYTQQ